MVPARRRARAPESPGRQVAGGGGRRRARWAVALPPAGADPSVRSGAVGGQRRVGRDSPATCHIFSGLCGSARARRERGRGATACGRRRTRSEYRNLQVALRRALDTADADLGLRLARTLQFVWKYRWPVGEGRPWIEEVLALPGAEAPTPARAVSLLTAAGAALEASAITSCRVAIYAEAVPLARQLGDPWILFVALADQAFVGPAARRLRRGAYASGTRALVVTRASGDQASEGILLLMCLGRLADLRGKLRRRSHSARKPSTGPPRRGRVGHLSECAACARSAALAQGDLATARALSSEGLNLPEIGPQAAGRAAHPRPGRDRGRHDTRTAREHLLERFALPRE